MPWPWPSHVVAFACLGLALVLLPIQFKPFRESEAIGSLAWRGLGIAPFKAFRESEAIGSLAWRGLGLLWHVVPWHWHGVALHALALTCLALRWHVVLGLGVP